jgi:hypothetical protein
MSMETGTCGVAMMPSCQNRSVIQVASATMAQLLLFLVLLPTSLSAWHICPTERGGGWCPDRTTCCPTGTQGVSACIPVVDVDHEEGSGQCCGLLDRATGCKLGYECAGPLEINDDDQVGDNRGLQLYCKATIETLIDDPWAPEVLPRYELCRVDDQAITQPYFFPILVGASHSSSWKNSQSPEQEDDDGQIEPAVYHLPYYSSMGDIAEQSENAFESVEKVLIIVHGSLRDADDYFCAGLTLLDEEDEDEKKVLLVAPKFASPNDRAVGTEMNANPPPSESTALVWAEMEGTYETPVWHPWRYGADAINAPISSFAVLDKLVEHFATSGLQFPNLQQIVVAGHSGKSQDLYLA